MDSVDILEENELVEEMQDQIKYKRAITPYVYRCINEINALLKRTDLNPHNLKLIVAGGAAFNHIVKSTTKIFQTHDFDLRLYIDIPPKSNPLFSKKSKDYKNWLIESCQFFAKEFASKLNKYCKSAQKRFGASKFEFVDHGFLSTVEYTLNGVVDSMVDIVPHEPSTSFNYNSTNLSGDYNYKQYLNGPKSLSKIPESRGGFFDMPFVYNQTKYGVYYASLGYLVWDTVRMLNTMIDARRFGFKKRKNLPEWTPWMKFDRYLHKYYTLLSALSQPELFVRCEAVDKFINKCNKVKKRCKIDGQLLHSKKEMFEYGKSRGFYETALKNFEQMDFDTICNSLNSF